ncbi:MAG: helix-turn-helix domain-containing protein [Hyphomicrobium sp.]
MSSDSSCPPSLIPILRFSTEHLSPDTRYEAWLNRDWPRRDPVYRTKPSEPFNVVMESAALGTVLLVRTQITAMTWERRAEDIRDSDYQPIIVNLMVQGAAEGDMDGRPFHELSGSYHFHDLARPSRHASTRSLTYALVLPREVAKTWFSPIERLHGLVVGGDAATAVIDLAQTAWRVLPTLAPDAAARFERALLELLVIGIGRPELVPRSQSLAVARLRAAAVEAIDHRLGLERASTSELARVLDVSVDQLTEAFRVDGGLAGYLLARRLEAASAALTGLERVEPIGNIAHRLGFSDAAHLSRAFRKRYGLSPRDYRKSQSNKS